MKKTIVFILLLTAMLQVQADELTQIANRYREWIIGNEQTDYKHPLIKARYQEILSYIESAQNKYDNFTFDSDLKFDFSSKNNQKEARTIFSEILFPLSLAYHLPGDKNQRNPYYQDINTKAKILYLYEYLRAKGWKEGLDMQYKNMDTYKETGVVGFGGSMGNNLLGYSISIFLNKELLKENDLLKNELKTLNWISNVMGSQYDFPKLWEVTGYNSDGIRSMLNNRLCYILALPTGDENRESEAKYFSKLFNKSLQIADGWADLIKSDYMGYHHKNAYLSAYAPNAFHTASLMVYLLKGSSLQIDGQAIENLSKAILNMRIYSNKYDCPRALSGRFPANLGVLVRNIPSYTYMAQVESPYQDKMKSAFMRLWDPEFEDFLPSYIENVACKIMYHGSIGALQMSTNMASQNIKAENDPNGFWYYPYGGLGIYRQNNWLISFKGNSKYIWDFESSKTENLYGRFASTGSLRILAGGSPVSAKESGYTIDGWNWTRLPGATTLDMAYEKLKSKARRNFTPESYLGGLKIDEKNALVSMKYDAPLSSLSMNKSFFFFDDYVLALGSNIIAPNEEEQVQTTLFQTGIDDLNTPSSVNGQLLTGSQHRVFEEENIFLTDTQGHAYFIKGKSKLSIDRYYQLAPLHHGKKEMGGNFSTARLIHGSHPNQESYQYYIQVNGGRSGAQYLSENHQNMFTVIQQDNKAHIVNYTANKTTAYALLEANKITQDKLVLQTDTPCLLMIKEKNDSQIAMSIQNPELGKIDEMITYNEVSQQWHTKSSIQPVSITLKGNWEIGSPMENVLISDTGNEETQMTFNCFDGKAINIELEKK